LINFGGNDYLGLAAERKASALATGSSASALVCGWTQLHEQLATRIASFESTEAAVLFPTGFAACSGTVATLAEASDLILSDHLNHASLIDGCRLSRAQKVIYPHRDCNAVKEVLSRRRSDFARAWIVTDGVFSMDGHIAPLAQLCEIADDFDATVIVDEAHGTGVLGKNGSGVCEAANVKDRVPIRIGTLSKAVGSQGGFVAGPRVVIDYLVNRCRSLIYSTALAPAAVMAAMDALDIITHEPERRSHVHRLAALVRESLSLPADSVETCVPIVPMVVGQDQAAIAKAQHLANRGFFVPAIRPPTVPEGTARLRISLSAAHDHAMVESLLAEL
jgi:8-amino-7-oxononanoate synthase